MASAIARRDESMNPTLLRAVGRVPLVRLAAAADLPQFCRWLL
jgi:hypothetical protein